LTHVFFIVRRSMKKFSTLKIYRGSAEGSAKGSAIGERMRWWHERNLVPCDTLGAWSLNAEGELLWVKMGLAGKILAR